MTKSANQRLLARNTSHAAQLEKVLIHVSARPLSWPPAGCLNSDVLSSDIVAGLSLVNIHKFNLKVVKSLSWERDTHSWPAADDGARLGIIPRRRLPREILEQDIRNLHLGWELGAPTRVALPVALVDLDGVVVVVVADGVVGDVADVAGAAAAAEAGLEVGVGAGPDLEAGAVGGVAEGDVEDVEVFDDVDEFGVLA